MAATVVLVPGGWAGSWIWRDVCAILDEHGVPNRAVDLPSCSATDSSVDFRDDANEVWRVVDEVGPSILVGNSYGGVVITEATVDNPTVRRLVYLAAFMPGAEDKLSEFLFGVTNPSFAEQMSFGDDGLVTLDIEGALTHAFPEASASGVELVRSHLTKPMSFGPTMETSVSGSSWKSTPSTYVVCTEDLCINPDAQREWAKTRATEAIEWPSDHCPHVSHPDLVADLVERLARDA